MAKNATRQPRRSRITGCSAMSRPARARARAATGGAVNTPAESGRGDAAEAIGLSRLPKVMSAPRSDSSRARKGYKVSPCSNAPATRRSRFTSPTAHSRSVSRGCCATIQESNSAITEIRGTSLAPSTDHQPGQDFGGVDEARSGTGRIGAAVDELDAAAEQGARRALAHGAELDLGARDVEPAQG